MRMELLPTMLLSTDSSRQGLDRAVKFSHPHTKSGSQLDPECEEGANGGEGFGNLGLAKGLSPASIKFHWRRCSTAVADGQSRSCDNGAQA
jgi:hypothetical protein